MSPLWSASRIAQAYICRGVDDLSHIRRMLHHRRRRAELVLWEPIDADASGAVFHARLLLADDDKRRCVVKLPPMMRSIKCPVRVSKRLLAGAPDALLLEAEARNAQRALDAPEARLRDAEDEDDGLAARAEW